MILLILTYFIKLKYHLWKVTHKFMGAAFFSGGLHALLIESDLSRNIMLKSYLLGLAAIAILVYIYRTLLGEWLVRKYSYTVTYSSQLTKNSWKIEMKPLKKQMNYHAGQFVFIQFLGKGVSGEWHPFSISSAVNEGVVDIIIKAEGDYTKVMGSVTPGVIARIEGPFGRFYPARETAQIWIAGGIGVTPFLSMAKSLSVNTPGVDLYYVVRGAREAVGYPRLQQLADKIKGLRVCLYDTTVEKGRLSAKTIADMSGGLSGKEIFICGPPPMMKSMRKQLIEQHVPASHIHTEEFNIQ
jgi:predicted ferric reductase